MQYELPEYQVALLKEIAVVNSNVIAVVMNGGAVAMPWADEVKAILECFYGGQGIGRAIVKVISGEVNPSGHMPVSVPAFREQIISDENFAEQTEQVTYREGMFMGYRGYETKKIPVQFPFGFGLSYTTFEITECSVEQEKITDCEKTVLRGKIKNTGNRKGAQVVQLYVKNPRAWKARPARELRDFQKIILEAGEEKEFVFSISRELFELYDERVDERTVPQGMYGLELGFSVQDIRAAQKIEVTPVFQYQNRSRDGIKRSVCWKRRLGNRFLKSCIVKLQKKQEESSRSV